MAMRATWTGAISFGMVVIPVKMYKATGSGDSVGFNWLCPEHPDSGVGQKKYCRNHGHEVTTKPLRGFPVTKDQWVVIEDSDLDNVPLPTAGTIKIVEFLPASELDERYLEGCWYLEPAEVGAKAYSLLRAALRETGKVALGKFLMRDREHFCRLALLGDAIIVHDLKYPAEIRASGELKIPASGADTPAEIAMAVSLVDSLTSERFDPTKYQDEFGLGVKAVVETKLAGGTVPTAPKPEPAPVADLMAVLQASVEQVRKAKEAA